MNQCEAAWLSGLWDGEGSIGISLNGSGKSLKAALQMSMTCEQTIRHAMSLIETLGVPGLGYTYQEREPEKQRDAIYLRVNRLIDIQTLGTALRPYSITKRRQWEIVLEFATLRLEGVEVSKDGVVSRGGSKQWWKPYTEAEWELYRELKHLNQRGPQGRNRRSTSQHGPLGAEGEATQQFV